MYMTTPQLQKACPFHCNNKAINISHTNQEISILMIKRRLTLLQAATENPKEGEKKQRTKDQETKNKIKHESSMNNSTSLTPVQVLSTAACMKVTSLSQLSH
jgi:hypothetical protein